MRALPVSSLTLAVCLLSALALADGKIPKGWTKIDYGKDRVYFPVSDGIQPDIAREWVHKGIYYASFARQGEQLNSFTNMIVVTVYPGVSRNPDLAPARAMLDLQVDDSRRLCPPEGLTYRFDAVANGRNGLMTACHTVKNGVPTLSYEYSVSFVATDQVFVISHMATVTGPTAPNEPPAKTISAWKNELYGVRLCSRTDNCQQP